MPPDASPGGQETALAEHLVFLVSYLWFLSERDWEPGPLLGPTSSPPSSMYTAVSGPLHFSMLPGLLSPTPTGLVFQILQVLLLFREDFSFSSDSLKNTCLCLLGTLTQTCSGESSPTA